MKKTLLIMMFVVVTFFSTGCMKKISPEEANAKKEQKRQAMQSIVKEISTNLVLIKGGTFTMGSPKREKSKTKLGKFFSRLEGEKEQQQVQVTVSSFYMSKYEVTRKEYATIMEENPWKPEMERFPMGWVSWYEAIEYCNRLSKLEGLTPAYTIHPLKDFDNDVEKDNFKTLVTWNRDADGYRLPTEAEWEYACRAGSRSIFNTGDTITTEQANFNNKYLRNKEWNNLPVGMFKPNAWGLYDMHGGVSEWCWDWFGYNWKDGQVDPIGASSGKEGRVTRGGSYSDNAVTLGSAYRKYGTPSYKFNHVGIRLVRSVQ